MTFGLPRVVALAQIVNLRANFFDSRTSFSMNELAKYLPTQSKKEIAMHNQRGERSH